MTRVAKSNCLIFICIIFDKLANDLRAISMILRPLVYNYCMWDKNLHLQLITDVNHNACAILCSAWA